MACSPRFKALVVSLVLNYIYFECEHGAISNFPVIREVVQVQMADCHILPVAN